MVICLERGADCLHMVQLMPLPSPNPIISYLIEIETGFTFLSVPAYPGCPGKEAVKRLYTTSSSYLLNKFASILLGSRQRRCPLAFAL